MECAFTSGAVDEARGGDEAAVERVERGQRGDAGHHPEPGVANGRHPEIELGVGRVQLALGQGVTHRNGCGHAHDAEDPDRHQHAAVDELGPAHFLRAGGDPLKGAVEEDPERDGFDEVAGVVMVQRLERRAQGVATVRQLPSPR